MDKNQKAKNGSILDGLNDQQKNAVTHKNGPLLIIAGAGTGKTTVLTRRIAYLIEQKVCLPSEILALTFTEKAAAEMEERVDLLVPYGYTDMWISTFHAFGDRLIRDYALDLGLPANFKVLTGTEQAIFIRENIYAFDLEYFRPVANPLSHIEAMLKHFSRLKDELISPEEYLSYAENLNQNIDINDDDARSEAAKTLELANAYKRYQDLMIQAGNLDFGDQIFLTHKLLKENQKVLKDCQNKFKYLLVDEYQDTNYAQNEIVKLLAKEDQNITVVGDDDQSIYKFRGASISNILDFKKTFSNTKEIVLNQNYRSTQEILDASYKLIQNNNPDRLEVKNNINKRLISPKNGPTPELLLLDTLSNEADKVASKIKELIKEKNYRYKDFAILVRANNQAEPFIQALNVLGIPHVFSGASGLLSQKEIKMLIAFLKCLTYSNESLAFYTLATSKLYNIKDKTLTEFYTKAKEINRPISSVIEYDLDNNQPKDEETQKLETLISDIEKYRQKKNNPCGEVLYDYLKEKEYLKKLVDEDSIESELEIHNIAKFFDRIAAFNHSSEERGVLAFLNALELILEVGDEIVTSDIDPDLDAVNILTAHASKGLEWPVVFIANCVADRFPTRRKREPLPIPTDLIKERLPEGDFHLEEERRLFYVAATRAKEYLYLTAGEDYGGKRAKKLSQFVMELLDQPKIEKLKHKTSSLERIKRFEKQEEAPTKLPDKFSEEILKLSRQQIDDYYTCPKKFYFAHIIKIPLSENQYFMYGSAIHNALDRYFSQKLRGESPTLIEMIEDYNQSFKNVGFITREQEEKRHKQGIATLTRFFDQDQKNPTIPYKVEESFEFFENNVKIRGRYDLITKEGEEIEIKDFKTSEVKTQKDADLRIKKSTQMLLYALAWYEKYNQIPKTTLTFIESGLEASKVFKIEDLENAKEMIFEVAGGIRKKDYDPKPDQASCRTCPYSDICSKAKS